MQACAPFALLLSLLLLVGASAQSNPQIDLLGYGSIVAVPNPPLVGDVTTVFVVVGNDGNVRATGVSVTLAWNLFGLSFAGWEDIGTQEVDVDANSQAILVFDYVFESREQVSLQAKINAVAIGGNTNVEDDVGQMNLEVQHISSDQLPAFQIPIQNRRATSDIVVSVEAFCYSFRDLTKEDQPFPAEWGGSSSQVAALKKGDRLSLVGFGSFSVSTRRAAAGSTLTQGESCAFEASVSTSSGSVAGSQRIAAGEEAVVNVRAATLLEEDTFVGLRMKDEISGEESEALVLLRPTTVEEIFNSPMLCCIKSVRMRVLLGRMIVAALDAAERKEIAKAISLLRFTVAELIEAGVDCVLPAEEKACVERMLLLVRGAARLLAKGYVLDEADGGDSELRHELTEPNLIDLISADTHLTEAPQSRRLQALLETQIPEKVAMESEGDFFGRRGNLVASLLNYERAVRLVSDGNATRPSRLSLSYPADSTAAFGVLRDWVAARKAAQARKEVERPETTATTTTMTASTANTPPPLAVTTTTTAASTMTTPPPLDTGPSATTPSCVPTILYSEFDVILVTVGGAKLNVVKAVKSLTGLGLKEAKDLVDAAPGPVKEGISQEEAEAIKGQLEEAGATVELRPGGEEIVIPCPEVTPKPCGVSLGDAELFDVILVAPGGAMLNVVKAVKSLTGLGLKDAKELVDAAPGPVKEGISQEEAEAMKVALEEAGAEVELKASGGTVVPCPTPTPCTITVEGLFDVIIVSVGGAKLNVVKAVKSLTGLGLKDAKELVDAAPGPVKEGISQEEAEAMKVALEEAGAEVELNGGDTVVLPCPNGTDSTGTGGGGGGGGQPEETEWDVWLMSPGGSKLNVVKAVKSLTGLGLKEAKDLVDAAPAPVKEKVSRGEAEAIKGQLEEAGAEVELK